MNLPLYKFAFLVRVSPDVFSIPMIAKDFHEDGF